MTQEASKNDQLRTNLQDHLHALDYVADMAEQLAFIVRKHGYNTVAYLLYIASMAARDYAKI